MAPVVAAFTQIAESQAHLTERLMTGSSLKTVAEEDMGGPYEHAIFEWVSYAHNAPSSDFLRGTSQSTLSVKDRISEVPSSGDKQAVKMFWAPYAANRFLLAFVDSMSDAEYTEQIVIIREDLYLLSCTFKDAKKGERQAQSVLRQAIKEYKGRGAPYSKLASVCNSYEQHLSTFSDKPVPYLWAILHSMESQFCSATEATARLAWEAGFQEKTLSNGVMPERALRETYRLCKQRYTDVGEARRETLHHFRKNIQDQVRFFDAPTCLYELEKLVMASSFATPTIDDGVRKLREYLESDTNGKRVHEFLNKKSAPSAVTPRPDAELKKRIHALEARLEGSSVPSTTTPQVSAVSGSYPPPSGGFGRKDAEWVAREGVVGYSAPIDQRKPPLFVVKIYSHMGELPDGFPESTQELVGSKCPGCKKARSDVPDSGWYYKPGQALFQSAGEGRIRPVVGKYNDGGPKYEPHTAWMHNAAFCSNVYADVHRWVRAHPEDKWMFDAVPAGENAYARPLRH